MASILVYDSMSALRARLEQSNEPALMLMRGLVNDAIRKDRITIWAWDSYGGNEERRKIFPAYKTRDPSPSPVLAALSLLKELLNYTPAFQIVHEGFEGDDLVAAVVERFRDKGHEIQIITRDGDLSALATTPDVTCTAKVVNYVDGTGHEIPPYWVPLYKLVVGDKSDTIPGLPGCGPKTWTTLDLAGLQELLNRSSPLLPVEEARARAIGLPTRCIKYLMTQEGVDELCAMRRIITPLPMTNEQFERALTRGTDNPQAREAMLSRFML